MAIKGPHVHMKPFSRNWIHYTIPEYTKSIKLTMTTGGGMGGRVFKPSDVDKLSQSR